MGPGEEEGGCARGRPGARGSAERAAPPVARVLGSSVLVLIRFSPGGPPVKGTELTTRVLR